MNKQELIDKQALIDKLMEMPGVGSNSDALETIKRFPAYKPQKPVAPKFVADYIQEYEGVETTLFEMMDNSEGKVYTWLFGNPRIETENARQLLFARAFMSGDYEVEKEQFYEVVFREDESDRYLLMELGEKCYEIAPESENDGYRTQCFTESEIKAIDERYWSFAVPVEEVAEG